jgi:cytochrome c oxidase assembly protein subunit 15
MTGAMTFAITSGSGRAANMAPVRAWLFALAGLVLLMVSVGGATRLTGSGLSITEWKPIVGTLPPLTDADWQEAFRKYQQIPQYEYTNKGMSLEAFKAIFWWEWTHRNLGRLIGIVFLLPFLFFLAAGYVSRRLGLTLAGIFALGGLQGVVGWYMVSSGLSDRLDVSQYRLALHLGLGVLILGALQWAALSLRADTREQRPGSRAPGRAAAGILLLVFLQILLGALVAGLKAGHAYNTWPWMDGRLIPSGLWAIDPWYLNLFENALTVQFNHRVAAYALLLAVLWRALALARAERHSGAFRSAAALALAVVAQVGLGIFTLLSQVPPVLGIAHQALAAVLFALAVWHLFETRHPRLTWQC